MSRVLQIGIEYGPIVEARFACPAPQHASEFEIILGIPVRFDAKDDGFALPLATFNSPNPKSDAVLRSLLEQHATHLLEKIPREDSFADRVRSRITDLLPSGNPGVEATAEALKMSARTVRRQL